MSERQTVLHTPPYFISSDLLIHSLTHVSNHLSTHLSIHSITEYIPGELGFHHE